MTGKKKVEAIGKRELAAALGWSRSRLDRRLDQDSRFPVRKRGNQAGGWEFDVAAVLAYLQQPAAPVAAPAPSRAAPVSTPTPSTVSDEREPAEAPARPASARGGRAPGVHHEGELTAAQRHKLAQARLLEDKLEQSRRALIDAEEMRLVVGTMLAHLGKGLDGLPDAALRRLELPEEARPVLQAIVDDLRRNAVADLKGLLQ
jgi:phage terminase Nu1 subunit (DNA packaging protein)